MPAVNDAVSNALAARLDRGEAPAAESLAGLRKLDPAWQRPHVCAWYGNEPLPLCNDFGGASLTYPEFMKGSFQDMVHDGGQLYLRVGSSMQVAGNTLTVVTGEPFDKDLVSKIASDLGEITLYTPAIKKDSGSKPPAPASSSAGSSLSATADQDRNKLVITKGNANDREELPARFTVGAVPESSGSFDREITFGTPLPVTEWKTGAPQQVLAVLQVTTRPAVLYAHLFAALGEFVRGVIYILLGIGIVFAIIELVALIIGTRMTRTVTAAVAELHNATRHVDRGDFSHRIPIRSNDQLSDLALSFNSMTASIEKLVQEQKEKQRLEGELAIAQEVQAQLYPKLITQLESLEVHGFCRPARTVSGDYYDFLALNSDKLMLAVGDISGKGISAALLMATIHSAVRAYSIEDRSTVRNLTLRETAAVAAAGGSGLMLASELRWTEASPAALLTLLNHQLYESTPDAKYATLFLGIYDGATRRLTYGNGGHLPPILISDDGSCQPLSCGGTVIGLFDNLS